MPWSTLQLCAFFFRSRRSSTRTPTPFRVCSTVLVTRYKDLWHVHQGPQVPSQDCCFIHQKLKKKTEKKTEADATQPLPPPVVAFSPRFAPHATRKVASPKQITSSPTAAPIGGLPCLPYPTSFGRQPTVRLSSPPACLPRQHPRVALRPCCLRGAASQAGACLPAPTAPHEVTAREPCGSSSHGDRAAARHGVAPRQKDEGSRRRPGRRATTTCDLRAAASGSGGGKARLPRWVELELGTVALCSPRRAAGSGGAACGGT